MSQCRRKSTHSSDESLHQRKDHKHGFISKLANDLRKLYFYETGLLWNNFYAKEIFWMNLHETDQIKWMNAKPARRQAYEPTEVRTRK